MNVELKDQLFWRREFKSGHSLKFNPPSDWVAALRNQFCIHFVHVGKCAGTSLMQVMGRDLKCQNIFEYHCYDANNCLDYSIETLCNDNLSNHFFVILTRDPLKRWCSSYNWDLHNLVLKKKLSIDQTFYSKFPNLNSLADGISNNDFHAFKFGRCGHMGMGLSFYVSQELLKKIPESQLCTIRTENIANDYKDFLLSLPSDQLRKKLLICLPMMNLYRYPKFLVITKKTIRLAFFPF